MYRYLVPFVVLVNEMWVLPGKAERLMRSRWNDRSFSDPRTVVLSAGQSYRAIVEATDPDSDFLAFRWDIRPEVEIPPNSYAGSMEKRAKPIDGLIGDPTGSEIAFTAPTGVGPYRLFVEIVDGQGRVAYGNVPFLVE